MSNARLVCPSCGSPQPVDAKKCSVCGEPLEAAAPAVAARDAAPPVPRIDPPAQPERRPAARPVNKPKNTKQPQKTVRDKSEPVTITLTIPVAILLVATAVVLVLIGYLFGAGKSGGSSVSLEDAPAITTQQGPDLQMLASLKSAVDARPTDYPAVLKYANALQDAEKTDLAIAQYRNYLAHVPENIDARIDMGVCYFKLGDFDTAIREMKIALGKSPSHIMGNFNLGVVYLNRRDTTNAVTYLEKARDLNPTSDAGKNAASLLQQLNVR